MRTAWYARHPAATARITQRSGAGSTNPSGSTAARPAAICIRGKSHIRTHQTWLRTSGNSVTTASSTAATTTSP